MKCQYWVGCVVAFLVVLGAPLALEIQEIGDDHGNWTAVGRQVVLAWQPMPEVASFSKADLQPSSRVTRWYCYGLGLKHSQHHSKTK